MELHKQYVCDCRVPNDVNPKHLFKTHWGRVTHICVGNLTIIGSVNGLSPGRHQAIIWTTAGILLIGPIATNFIEILIKIITFSFKKMRSKVSSGKRRPSCLGLNVLKSASIYPEQYTTNAIHVPDSWMHDIVQIRNINTYTLQTTRALHEQILP